MSELSGSSWLQGLLLNTSPQMTPCPRAFQVSRTPELSTEACRMCRATTSLKHVRCRHKPSFVPRKLTIVVEISITEPACSMCPSELLSTSSDAQHKGAQVAQRLHG